MKTIKAYIWLIIVLLPALPAWSQSTPDPQAQAQQAIDSLQGLLLQAETDSLKAVIYTNLSGAYRFSNRPNDAVGAAKRALMLAQSTKQNNMISNAYAQLGRIYLETGEYPLAIDAYQQSISILGDTGYILPKAFRIQMLGKSYELQQLYEDAEKKYIEAYSLLESKPDTSINYLGSKAFALNNLGNIATLQEKPEEGIKYQLESINVRRQMGDSLNLAYSYNDLAEVYAQMGKNQEAKPYYEQAWQIFTQMGKKRELAIVGVNLANAVLALNQPQLALEYATNALQNAYAVNEKGVVVSITRVLALAYAELGMYKKAFEAQQTHTAYRDSIFNEQRLREIGRLESKIELQEKDAENQKQQLVIEQQQTTNLIIGSALIILLFLSILLLRLQRQQKKANNLLQLQNEEINQQKEELTAQAEVLKEANEEIGQQKEEIYAQAETLRNINQEMKVKNTLLTETNVLIEKKNIDIMASINYASRIQNALLPFNARLDKAFQNYFILFQPRDVVSGDFYWFGEVGQKQIIAAIDCTGHGVPGAFMALLGHGALNDIILRKEISSPEKILEALDEQISNVLQQRETDNRDGMDAAICVIDKEAKQLLFAGAKNPLVLFQNNEMKVIKGNPKSVGGRGGRQENDRFTCQQFALNSPTTFYIYSDGYQDQFGGPHGKKFMAKKFRTFLEEIHHLPMKQQQTELSQKLADWKGNAHKQIDDILVIGVEL